MSDFITWEDMNICPDCLVFCAYGYADESQSKEYNDNHAQRVSQNVPEGYRIAAFSETPDECIYQHDDDNRASECYNDRCNGNWPDDYEGEAHFSNSPCELCDGLPGHRFHGDLVLDKIGS